ncbi:chaplin [Streptomyces sp. NPDC088812]|uniref:chaplin n=1 Tax=Streptomyces sp. NPDC088812 TaxID=3365905 RepID=UPI00380AA1A5
MRQVTRKSLMTVAAATGVIAAAGGYAHADSGAHGSASHSPGVASGNTVQAPVDVPVNVCGNTVDVIGILNPAVGNSCANRSADHGGGGRHTGGGQHGGGEHGGHGGDQGGPQAHSGSGGAHAGGHTAHSPGVASGNHIEAPIHVPVNVCGNSIDVIGALNPTTGNHCADDSAPTGHDYGTPPGDRAPGDPGTQNPGKPADSAPAGPEGAPSTPERVTPAGHASARQPARAAQPAHSAQLARTGSELPLGLALPVGAGTLLAGAVLYRKARASA